MPSVGLSPRVVDGALFASVGLGLTPSQTVVVGTRALEFLLYEKSDVKTQQQLLERVKKRAVKVRYPLVWRIYTTRMASTFYAYLYK